ncbi:LOW QUALITY PROTEIN: complement C1q subcomponent subunit B [Vipera latastei]
MLSAKVAVGVLMLCLPAAWLAQASSCQGPPLIPGTPGMPGAPGSDGQDGVDGSKGERGPPGRVEDFRDAGEVGEPGTAGFPGKFGPRGPTGAKGPPGAPGPRGPKGESGDAKASHQSAFSATRGYHFYPERARPVRFDRVITNVGNHYNNRYGQFTCQIPGIYYFSYHATSRGNLCLQLKKGRGSASSEIVVTFCDYALNTFQVTTGGLVLRVAQGEMVWLEPTEKNSLLGGIEGSDSIFSGFLLFPEANV